MTSVNVTTQKNTVTVQQGDATTVTVTTQGAQGATGADGADGAGISAGDKGALTVAANLTDWTLNKPIDLGDNEQIRFGNSQDLKIYHSGSHSIIQENGTGNLLLCGSRVNLLNSATNETLISAQENGPVELYFNNLLRLATTNNGIKVSKDIKITAESVNDFESGRVRFIESNANLNGGYIHYDGSANKLKLGVHPFNDSTVGNDVDCIEIDRDAKNVELNFAGVKKAETTADGLNLPDNSKLQLGDSQDLQLFHDGSASVIKDAGTGMLKILGSTIAIKNGSDNKICATFSPNTASTFFHNGIKKLETTSSGITVQGSVTTEDMNMSNLNGTANEVDNTKGSWSIQEGADDLFLINRVSGKKYKFNLTEIS